MCVYMSVFLCVCVHGCVCVRQCVSAHSDYYGAENRVDVQHELVEFANPHILSTQIHGHCNVQTPVQQIHARQLRSTQTVDDLHKA